MNGYVGFYKGKRAECEAETKYEAQQKLTAIFKQMTRRNVKGHDIAIELAEKDGEQVSHTG